jgi:dephospho-CoA kinase
MKKVIGITGGIGSGKTVVSKVFASMGIPVYDSDNQAKFLVNSDQDLQSKIISLLGEGSFVNGIYNTAYVSGKIFSNPDLLSSLNGLIHPAVQKHFGIWKETQTSDLVIKETALLFQTELWKKVDYKILVLVPQSVQIERVKKRDPQRNLSQIQSILDRQGDYSKYESMADFVIYNYEKQSVLLRVLGILEEIQKSFS